jgi:hypothetical protein
LAKNGLTKQSQRVAAAAGLAGAIVLMLTARAGASLLTANNTPFPSSKVIVGARWESIRYSPPANQWGDILPTVWAADGNQYTMIDDGGADVPLPGGIWRQSVARVTGTPPKIHITHVGNPNAPPPHTFTQIRADPSLWLGPLGPYYSSGLLAVGHVLFATEENDWNWKANGPFTGLHGIAVSVNEGATWTSPSLSFPAPLGNLSWVIRAKGGYFPDGWAYAIASEREFNADNLILGRAHPDIADITDPSKWQWQTGWQNGEPVFSNSFQNAVPMVSWPSHLTYPQMAYDAPLGRYLLTLTYSFVSTPPGVWTDGADLVILEAPHPWGPFSFVAQEPKFGPSNGYAAGFPVKWISPNGRDLWLKWSANFDGCGAKLDCAGGYGFNYRQIHLTLAGDHSERSTLVRGRRAAAPATRPVDIRRRLRLLPVR